MDKSYFLSALLLFLIWEIIFIVVGNSLLLPGPIETAVKLVELITTGALWTPLLSTVAKATLGMLLALLLSLFTGFLLGISNFLYILFRPVILTLQAVPIVSWLALAILWWGVGFRSPMYIVFLTLFPIMTLNIIQGVRSVDIKLIEMAKVFSLKKGIIFKDIYLGSILPFVFSSLKISSGAMWKSVAVAEFMVGATGIGRKIADAKYFLDTSSVFAYTLVLVFLGLVSETVFNVISKKVFNYAG
ncbi:ABC transporter permease [Kosmotoga arenicorallina S304]|uniref:ABC transporter permease n=1 Tax=Kosmotoga arenicorallina S304 TaxID=1453497 RepID=A0A176K309_9BACT|nr:ABC transporter permease subunit [Kosmotoga arenicorallina]OAA31333.1 ABC transporter permease [Kosmotoga arenicorallina S304]